MRHRTSIRSLTPEEAARIHKLQFSLWEELGTIMMPVLPAGGIVLLWIVFWTGVAGVFKLLGGEPPEYLANAMALGCFVIGAAGWLYFFIRFRKDRIRRRKDLEDKRVELVQIEGARVLQREEYNDEGPIYYFGIGEGKVLVLQGQWLMDNETFGLPPPEVDENDEIIGEKPFPVSAFIVHRMATSGDVLKIELQGPRIQCEGVISLKKKLPPWLAKRLTGLEYNQSLLLNGDFSELAILAGNESGT